MDRFFNGYVHFIFLSWISLLLSACIQTASLPPSRVPPRRAAFFPRGGFPLNICPPLNTRLRLCAFFLLLAASTSSTDSGFGDCSPSQSVSRSLSRSFFLSFSRPLYSGFSSSCKRAACAWTAGTCVLEKPPNTLRRDRTVFSFSLFLDARKIGEARSQTAQDAPSPEHKMKDTQRLPARSTSSFSSSSLSGAGRARKGRVAKGSSTKEDFSAARPATKQEKGEAGRCAGGGAPPRRSSRLRIESYGKTEAEVCLDSVLLKKSEIKTAVPATAVDFDRFRHPEKPEKPGLSTPLTPGPSVHTTGRRAPQRRGRGVCTPEDVAGGYAAAPGAASEGERKVESFAAATEAGKVKQECLSGDSFRDQSFAFHSTVEKEDAENSRALTHPVGPPSPPRGFLFTQKGKRRKREDETTTLRELAGCAELDLEDLPQNVAKKTDEPFANLPDSPEPPHFQDIWDAVTEMRAKRDAPVDSMGVEAMGELALQRDGEKAKRFSVLVAVMLSSQTKDEQTAACMQRLRDADVLSPEKMSRLSVAELSELLYGVGFYQNKARFLKEACQILLEKYGGDIPPTYEELVQLKGVGPKMANIAVHAGWNRVEGIAVDVHVHRITNRLNWVRTKNPIETQHALQKFLRRSLWGEINLLFVGFGQQICRPVNPLCSACKASQWCPVGRKASRKEKKTPEIEVEISSQKD
ncbi:UNVERIFIED_CONTAM: endonuclease III family 1 protein [Hammondia hammondi]|eukprot:XP_008884852.1 endonuclease III family 1 protein [Hammondia hammondi]